MTFSTNQKHRLLSRMGYAGPAGEEGMKSFLQTNPAAAKKFLAFNKAAATMGSPAPTAPPAEPTGFAEGGVVSQQLKDLYQQNFNRAPDEAGAAFWQSQLDSGYDINKIQETFAQQAAQDAAASTTTQAPVQTAVTPTQTTQTATYTAPQTTTTGTPTGAQTLTGDAARPDLTGDLNTVYQQLYGRDIDPAGLEFWTNQINSGSSTIADLQRIGSQTPEAQQYAATGTAATPTTDTSTTTPTPTVDYSGVTDITALPAFDTLNTMYSKYYGADKPLDLEGAKFWQQQLDAGFAPAEMERIFKETTEGVQYTAEITTNTNETFREILGRTPTEAEKGTWTDFLRSGNTIDQMKELVAEQYSGEGVVSLYKKLYGREPTAEELSAFEAGGSDLLGETARLETLFSETEAQIVQAYRDLFGRNPDQDGLDFYMNEFRKGTPVEDILNMLADSDERQTVEYTDFQMNQDLLNAQKEMVANAYGNPSANVTTADVALMEETPGTIIDPATGQVTGSPSIDPSLITSTATATLPEETTTNTVDVTKVSDQVQQELNDLEAAKGTVSELGTVRGQLELLMEDFENDGTPPWASGAMRAAMSKMQARGLGASSMAGQAIVQAAMESALPIAMQDASTNAQFEMQNLTNEQQTVIFKAQQRFAGIFSDQAAENAAKQFNASSQNQTDQFFASLEESVSRFNATQVNAITKSNVDSENAAKQFNAQMQDMRDRFNATNGLVIAQANAQWRQNINTINTAAQNDANMEAAKTANAFTGAALEQLWQRERDLMAFAFTSSESALDREVQMLLADKQVALAEWQQGNKEDEAKGYLVGSLISKAFDWFK
jgi:hypothetical protein